MLIPYSVDLRFNRLPWVTLVIIVLCLVIHYAQQRNRAEIDQAATTYCRSAPDLSDRHGIEDDLYNSSNCEWLLRGLHRMVDHNLAMESIREEVRRLNSQITEEELSAAIRLLNDHYRRFTLIVPSSLDDKLKFDPRDFNPFQLITYAFAHGDWGHVLGNMVFLYAFAPALELAIGSTLVYIGAILFTALGAVAFYALIGVMTGGVNPMLGYSGVVMGMIGLAAYLIPKARIRALLWLGIFIKRLLIPVWVLALWYIGWDLYDLMRQGRDVFVAYSAHVGGGVCGYLFGRMWLKQHKEDIADDLADEVEYMRSQRADSLGMTSSYKGGRKRFEAQAQAQREQVALANWIQQIYQLATHGQEVQATVQLIAGMDQHGPQLTALETVYAAARTWTGAEPFMQRLGRILIAEMVQLKRNGKALALCEQMYAINSAFTVGDPNDLQVLAETARDARRFDLAVQLTERAIERYPRYAGALYLEILALHILLQDLDREAVARRRFMELSRIPALAKNNRLQKLRPLFE